MKLYPDYPVIKLRIAPGEAYIAPTGQIIHDGTSMGKQYPDVTLHVREAVGSDQRVFWLDAQRRFTYVKPLGGSGDRPALTLLLDESPWQEKHRREVLQVNVKPVNVKGTKK